MTGLVVQVDPNKPSFNIRARSGDVFEVMVGPPTWYQMLSNLDNLGRDRVPEPQGVAGDDGVRYSLQK